MDFSYSQQQLEIKRGIREWGKKHLTEEAIAAGYKKPRHRPRDRQGVGRRRLGKVRPGPRSTVESPSTIRPWP